MCKFLATTVAEATASKCVNWMGGNGITEQVRLRVKVCVFVRDLLVFKLATNKSATC